MGLKCTKCHPNGIKIIVLPKKIAKIAQRLDLRLQTPLAYGGWELSPSPPSQTLFCDTFKMHQFAQHDVR